MNNAAPWGGEKDNAGSMVVIAERNGRAVWREGRAFYCDHLGFALRFSSKKAALAALAGE